MVSLAKNARRLVGAALAALVWAAMAVAGESARQAVELDPMPIVMTAQDSTGVVWGTRVSVPAGLFRWQNGHWTAAASGVPAGAYPIGVWQGPDGGVVVVWSGLASAPPVMSYQGDQQRQLGTLPRWWGRLRLFTTTPHSLWITSSDPQIDGWSSEGGIKPVYKFQPDQFFSPPRSPGPAAPYGPFIATASGNGTTWFWSNAAAGLGVWAALQGILIYDGHAYQYHSTLPGLPPRAITYLGMVGRTHAWIALLHGGIYSVDTQTLEAQPVPEPGPNAFNRVTRIFTVGDDHYVVSNPFGALFEILPGHRLSSTLWRERRGHWEKILGGLDDARYSIEDWARPAVTTVGGLWLGTHAAGLWFVPSDGESPRLIDWRRGFPLASVNRLYKLRSHKLLAVDLEAHRTAAFDVSPMLRPAPQDNRLQAINPYTMLQQDAQQRVWGILSLKQQVLSEWDGDKWTSYPLPGNLEPNWFSGLDADSHGNIWLFPDCRMGPSAALNAASGHWATFPSYQRALAEWNGGRVEFAHAKEDRMKPIYGPGKQIVYMGACNGINYFDGTSWRLWNRPTMPGDRRYFFDGPAFFDATGRLAVNIDKITWEMQPSFAWQQVAYEPRSDHLVNWFMPARPLAPPAGCSVTQSTSLVQDRLGRSWWTWNGSVYVGIPGRCRQALSSDEAQPFIDGRLLRRALIDNRGNVFFETLLEQHRLGEYVLLRSQPVETQTTIRLTSISPDSVRAEFSTNGAGNLLTTWRLDRGPWSAPGSSRVATFDSLPSGTHTIEADTVDEQLNMNPAPASAIVHIGVMPEQQIDELVHRLIAARSDDQREAAIHALAAQPPSRALTALQAARAQASPDMRWWIDAAIQAIEQKDRP